MTTTITAAFEDPPAAQRAQESLAEHGIGKEKVTLLHDAGVGLPGTDAESATYNEALRRGSAVLLARVDTVRDTVRRTEVDIEGDAAARPAGRLSNA